MVDENNISNCVSYFDNFNSSKLVHELSERFEISDCDIVFSGKQKFLSPKEGKFLTSYDYNNFHPPEPNLPNAGMLVINEHLKESTTKYDYLPELKERLKEDKFLTSYDYLPKPNLSSTSLGYNNQSRSPSLASTSVSEISDDEIIISHNQKKEIEEIILPRNEDYWEDVMWNRASAYWENEIDRLVTNYDEKKYEDELRELDEAKVDELINEYF
jgi:hypothetical protein